MHDENSDLAQKPPKPVIICNRKYGQQRGRQILHVNANLPEERPAVVCRYRSSPQEELEEGNYTIQLATLLVHIRAETLPVSLRDHQASTNHSRIDNGSLSFLLLLLRLLLRVLLYLLLKGSKLSKHKHEEYRQTHAYVPAR